MKMYDSAAYNKDILYVKRMGWKEKKIMNVELRNALNMGGNVERQKWHGGENPSTKKAV